jgi:hypothetical protein
MTTYRLLPKLIWLGACDDAIQYVYTQNAKSAGEIFELVYQHSYEWIEWLAEALEYELPHYAAPASVDLYTKDMRALIAAGLSEKLLTVGPQIPTSEPFRVFYGTSENHDVLDVIFRLSNAYRYSAEVCKCAERWYDQYQQLCDNGVIRAPYGVPIALEHFLRTDPSAAEIIIPALGAELNIPSNLALADIERSIGVSPVEQRIVGGRQFVYYDGRAWTVASFLVKFELEKP